MKGYKIEYQTGKVTINNANLLVKDITDMEILEYWETRLKRLNQPFTIAYRSVGGQVRYSIFAKLRAKGSPFR